MKRKIKERILVVFVCISIFYIIYSVIKNDDVLNISVVVEKNGQSETISLKKQGGRVVVYLPSYADLTSVKFIVDDDSYVYIDGDRVCNGSDCSNFEMNREYVLKYLIRNKSYDCTFLLTKSSNIPTVFVDTESGSMDYIHGNKHNSESGKIRLYNAEGILECDESIKSITGRGNTTWDAYEKKPYNIELENEVKLLEMSVSDQWVLLANANDPSHIRNKLVYDFAKDIGLKYTPEGEWINLYLNNEYVGLYLITEKNEIKSGRINVDEKDSFVVSLEKRGRMVTQNLPYILTDAEQTLRIRYPKKPTQSQIDELHKLWQSIENSIICESGIDEETGKAWQDLIDIDSWAKKYLLEEVFGNLDACYISQYFYLDGSDIDARVYAGPAWDYDLTMGRAWQTDILDFMIANRYYVDGDRTTPWFFELYRKEAFYSEIRKLYYGEFAPLLIQVVEKRIEHYASYINDAARMDAIRWDTEDFEVEVEKIRSFLTRRIEFLWNYWIDEENYRTITAHCEDACYAYYVVGDGLCVTELPVLEDTSLRTFLGWFYEDGSPFDFEKPILEDMSIYARWSGAPSFFIKYGEYLMPLAIIGLLGLAIFIAERYLSHKRPVIKRAK